MNAGPEPKGLAFHTHVWTHTPVVEAWQVLPMKRVDSHPSDTHTRQLPLYAFFFMETLSFFKRKGNVG